MDSGSDPALRHEAEPEAPAAPRPEAGIRDELIACLPQLRAFARSLAGHRDLADDLVQEAIVRALAAQGSFRPGTNFRAWIFTILRNLFFTERRKSRMVVQSIDTIEQELSPVAAAQESKVEFDDFRLALMKLPHDQREALILVGASGMSYEEAAQVSGCAVGTVKSRVSRARRTLAQLTGRNEDGEPGRGDEPRPPGGSDPIGG
ncbi:sigma-70 family RNA polymerase sigma factor [Stella sp.]|uniref:sigma-70 family RNA polymerase sigma factor n=1 Tax=Stella sp. TaxID=2912054 RepID=UPI0035AFA718